MAACRVLATSAVIDQKLYWAEIADDDEALFLCGVFNSDVLTKAVAPYQSTGQFGTRDFDKYVFELDLAKFDYSNPLHKGIAGLAQEAEAHVASLVIPTTLDFKSQRKRVRDSLREVGLLESLDDSVARLLGVQV